MEKYDAYCKSCNTSLAINPSIIKEGREQIKVRCPKCSNIFNFNVPTDSEVIEATTKTDYYFEKGKETAKKVSQNKDVRLMGKSIATFIGICLFVFLFGGMYFFAEQNTDLIIRDSIKTIFIFIIIGWLIYYFFFKEDK